MTVIELMEPKPDPERAMTFKQYKYIMALARDVVPQPALGGLLADKSASWLMTNVSKRTASKIIDSLKTGNGVSLMYPTPETKNPF